MTPSGIYRWVIVAAYTLLGVALAGGGMSEGDFTAMLVFGILAVVAVLLAGWIDAAPRRER